MSILTGPLNPRINYEKFVGKKFGKLTVESFSRVNKNTLAHSKCECGNQHSGTWQNIKRGLTISCGCEGIKSRIKHGLSRSRTYTSWENMINRCTPGSLQSENCPQYKLVPVCGRWRKFENFLEDMGERPNDKSLDRIDPLKGYSPDNCRWATRLQQARNKKNTLYARVNGERRPLAEWCETLNISREAVRYWSERKGFSLSDALAIVIKTKKERL